ncbi:MAG: GNAT family N-acetyltransferase [Rhizobiaceae bacterium]
MVIKSAHKITFSRLPEISSEEVIAHMSDPRVAEHMPLLTFKWDQKALDEFIRAKEDCWARDGLGHWAILCDGTYVGWGGFQKEGDEWDFGLVLKPEYFGLGARITKKAIEFAKSDENIPFVTFLLPLSRTRIGGLLRFGASLVGEVEYDGIPFRKYRLDTE